jgi:hypothetical protein
MLLTFGNLYWRQLSSQGGTPRANPSNALFAQDHLCQALPCLSLKNDASFAVERLPPKDIFGPSGLTAACPIKQATIKNS